MEAFESMAHGRGLVASGGEINAAWWGAVDAVRADVAGADDESIGLELQGVMCTR